MIRFSAAARSNHPQHASVYAAHAFAHDASKLGGAADSCGNSASPEDIWSEWQDLNLRPPRPERVPPQENSTFSVKYGYVRGRSFTFGCGISVGKLSGDGSARSQHSPDNPDGDGRTRGRTSGASCRRSRRSRAWAPRAAPAM